MIDNGRGRHLHVARELGQAAKSPEAGGAQDITIVESKIEEDRVFTEEEILGLIQEIAQAENIKPHQLEVIGRAYDKSHNLVAMAVRVVSGRARGEGWKSIHYEYMIKGKHPGIGASLDSHIVRLHNADDPSSSHAGVVAEFAGGAWNLTPGSSLIKLNQDS